MRIQKRRPLLNRSEHVFFEGAFMVEGEEKEGNPKGYSGSFSSPRGDRLQLDTIIDYPVSQLYSQSWTGSHHGSHCQDHGYNSYDGYYYNHHSYLCETENSDPPNITTSSSSSSIGVKSELSYENKGGPLHFRETSSQFLNRCTAKSDIDLNLSAPSSPLPLPFYTFTDLFKTARDVDINTAQPTLLAESNFKYTSNTLEKPYLSPRSFPSICRPNNFEDAKAAHQNQGHPGQNAELANNLCSDGARKGRQRREKGNNSSDKVNKASVGRNKIGEYPEKEEEEEGAKQCNRKDGRGWQCSQRVKEGFTYCEHHLVKIKANHARSAVKMAMLRKKLKEECSNPSIINKYSHRNNSAPVVASSKKRKHCNNAYYDSSFVDDGQQTYEKKMKMKKNSLEDANPPIIFWFNHPPL